MTTTTKNIQEMYPRDEVAEMLSQTIRAIALFYDTPTSLERYQEAEDKLGELGDLIWAIWDDAAGGIEYDEPVQQQQYTVPPIGG